MGSPCDGIDVDLHDSGKSDIGKDDGKKHERNCKRNVSAYSRFVYAYEFYQIPDSP